MKQQSAHLESRPEMFRELFKAAMDDLRSRLQRVTIHGTVKWIGGADRKRVRKLAREQARLEMRQMRAAKVEQP